MNWIDFATLGLTILVNVGLFAFFMGKVLGRIDNVTDAIKGLRSDVKDNRDERCRQLDTVHERINTVEVTVNSHGERISKVEAYCAATHRAAERA